MVALTDQEKGLSILVSSFLRDALKPWPEQLGMEVSLARPSFMRGESEQLQKDLPWPLVATTLEMEGDMEGRLTVLLSVSDAVKLAGWKKGKEPEPDPSRTRLDGDEQEAMKALHESFADAAAGVFKRKARKTVRFEYLATQEITRSWELAEDGVTVEGWLASTKLTLGVNDPIPLWVWIGETVSAGIMPALSELQEQPNDTEFRIGGGGGKARSASKGTVLVVDDVAVTRTLIRQHLEQVGYAVIEAENGEEALGRVAQTALSLVVLDLQLPGMNGYEVCRRIKGSFSRPNVPVIICSASAQKKDIMEAVKAGANDYIVKPFETATLLQKIANAISSSQVA